MYMAQSTHGVATVLGKQFFACGQGVQTPAIPFACFAAQLCATRCKAPRLHKVSTPVSLRDPSAQGDNRGQNISFFHTALLQSRLFLFVWGGTGRRGRRPLRTRNRICANISPVYTYFVAFVCTNAVLVGGSLHGVHTKSKKVSHKKTGRFSSRFFYLFIFFF
jgi:hypothetical protein